MSLDVGVVGPTWVQAQKLKCHPEAEMCIYQKKISIEVKKLLIEERMNSNMLSATQYMYL